MLPPFVDAASGNELPVDFTDRETQSRRAAVDYVLDNAHAAQQVPYRAVRELLGIGPIMSVVARSLAVGAEPSGGGVSFRVWAPEHAEVTVVGSSPNSEFALDAESGGYFSGIVPGFGAGTLYRFRLDGGEPLSDPVSRFQPEGPLGASEVVDPHRFPWSDGAWRGLDSRALVLYELHVGTFTPEGTWDAARRKLPLLAELGINAIEIMPVADWVGAFGWGYDGVCLFAPTRLYGRPDAFRRFVDAAHGLGVGVILDVVYNHVGPVGSVLARYSRHYSGERTTEWGAGFDFDGPHSAPVRELVTANAFHWISEYHLDGLRLDATQDLADASDEHIVAAITNAVRAAAPDRATVVLAENEPQDAKLLKDVDAIWNDDFHHACSIAATGRREAYYDDYQGSAQELVSLAKHGFLYQGQWNLRQGKRRGTPVLAQPPWRFVVYLQNHDQVANSLDGSRLHELTSHGRLRALTAFLLLAPQTPLLFQGQEFAASSPFLYFADHDAELAAQVRRGRREFLGQWRSLAALPLEALVADPAARETFERSKLVWSDRDAHPEIVSLHRDLLALRRADPVLGGRRATGIDGALLGPECFLLRRFGADGDDRLLFVNLGADLQAAPLAQPLACAPAAREWEVRWSSEDPRYGGAGDPPWDAAAPLTLRGHAALLLAAVPLRDEDPR